MLRGIRLGEYVEGNMFHCFAIVINYCFSHISPLLQSKPPPDFNTVDYLWVM